MIALAQTILSEYIKLKQTPLLDSISDIDSTLINQQWCLFVTLYKKWEICGSAGNIKELKANIAEELIENIVSASQDSRFPDIDINEVSDIKIRIDTIQERSIIPEWSLKDIDPVTHGVLVLKKDYSNMAAILPNIDPKILTGSDYHSILAQKLWQKEFKEKEHIIYKISTQQETNF